MLSFAEKLQRDQEQLRKAFNRIDCGESVDFSSFEHSYSVRIKPISWEELNSILADGRDEAMASLGRSPLVLKEYWTFCQQVIKKNYERTADYLYCKVFGVPARCGAEGKQVAQVPPDFREDLLIVWRENDFPYSFDEGMEHHNVWANRPLTQEELQQEIAKRRHGYEYVYYINPASVMSVPEIWHAHVISRPSMERSGCSPSR